MGFWIGFATLLIAATSLAGPPLIPKVSTKSSVEKVILNGVTVDDTTTDPTQLEILKSTVRLMRVDTRSGRLEPMCSGIIKSDRQILTAGHCVNKGSPTHVEVYDPKSPDKKKTIPIEAQNGEFNEGSVVDPDLGVIQLKESVPEGSKIAELADKPCDKDSEYIVAGYGFWKKNEMPEQLQTAKRNRKALSESESNLFTTAPSMSGEICQGDSGGPLFCHVDGKLKVSGISGVITTEKTRTGNPRVAKYYSAATKCMLNEILVSTKTVPNLKLIEKLSQFPPAPAEAPQTATVRARK